MPRNPAWTRDELILALELYFRVSPSRTSGKNPEIIALSQLLKRLPIHPDSIRAQNFRSPDSVYLKLCNFLHVDPDYRREGKVGLDAGSKLDQEVWDYYSSNKQNLAEIAASIRAHYETVGPIPLIQDTNDDEFPEGRIIEQTHKMRERNAALIKKKKEWGKQHLGRLYCEVCGFDFQQKYGDLGKDFIECHHIQPLSSLTDVRQTKIGDLVLICANCHRVLHRNRPWIDIGELKKHLK